ncbi:methylmalonyl Co-A mutase-associated GTPase MeaB [Oligoflexus tunisiensis]|uniref:methylmalonyl Co-A mutase-associated GTPase MeaB n=1 Tax=Oligoflexus tunisiensis TaxID=708132 RepID=UPI00114D0761|nr:methylmalonyl Co-A mutase-associated GTPase MeaB [Oligoflexus tunisiensis]
MSIDLKGLEAALISGDRRGLAKALTLIESRRPEHRLLAGKLLSAIYSKTGRANRIGITGSPGVGKSTFIEALGKFFLQQGHKLAVLAIDPSSPRSHGSILGDKTRMAELAVHPDCFIRPSPSGLSLGGVARRTRECVLLCEAAGYDTIMIETVGVGQSETLVSSMVDIFMFLQLPNAGDQLQGIKKGILELADLVVVTKADGAFEQAARRAKVDHEMALHYMQPDPDRLLPRVMMCSAVEKKGLHEIYDTILGNLKILSSDGRLQKRRQQQREQWFESELHDQLMDSLLRDRGFKSKVQELKGKVMHGTMAPTEAAQQAILKLNLPD